MKSYRFFSVTLFALGLLSSGVCFTGCDIQKWEPLFNGENLEGWKVICVPADIGKEYWTVKDGYIEANSMGDPDHSYIWLAFEKEYTDFHLKLEFQAFKSSPGNSGMQFRSRFDDSDTARNGGWMNGPQVDIHPPNPMRAGLIYDETENVRRWIYPSLPDSRIVAEQAPESALRTSLVYHEDDSESWNEMEIICEGMNVTTIVNGNTVALFDGEGILNDDLHKVRGSGERGYFALQLHVKDELQIRYKDILLKEL